ncbi:MAG: SUMF1/EgtB/PvdO family nonheme iron enzyme [Ignavibacteriae bacterium]|nr:SUMF1/EgtB/PvdO family nonheme iron enzyme [Ignavibacteriota bacterium]
MLLSCSAFANKDTVTNVSITGQNTTDHYAKVQFDLSWDNSWRTVTPNNWDAAWVFVKYKSTSNYVSSPGATSGLAYASANTSTSSSYSSFPLTNATSSGTTITVSSPSGLVVGMQVIVTAGTGVFPAGTTVTAISGNTFTVSAQPTTALSGATVTGYLHTITVGSTTNLSVGVHVAVTAGTGVFPTGTYVSKITDGTRFTVSNTPTTVLSGATVTGYAKITVTSTLGLCVGMPVSVTGGGAFVTGTVVTAITGVTTFSVSTQPSTALTGGANVVTGTPVWSHATINLTGNTAPSGTITPASDGTGAFIYRSADNAGTFTNTGAQLRWNYGVDKIADGASVSIKVFAIEMVYVPQDAFYVGDESSYGTLRQTGSNIPYQITTTGSAIMCGNPTNYDDAQLKGSGIYVDGDGGISKTTSTNTDMNPYWPTGYNAFYCMKYEIMQQQYVDFLNILTYTQQATRTPKVPTSAVGTYLFDAKRHKIKIKTTAVYPGPASYETDNPYVACNYLSWDDLAAYLDWSGLRPMTELEFEKSCRGTITPPFAGHFAWGTSITQNTGITNSGAYNETGIGNCTFNNHASVQGPMRVGAFATPTSTRVTSGATYYGIMEMSGNLFECPITIGNITGRGFTGTHGNGILTSIGDADASTWPGTDAVGTGNRGGSWVNPIISLGVSERYGAAAPSYGRSEYFGGRGVRTAP